MGVRVYDPTGRRTAPARNPWAPRKEEEEIQPPRNQSRVDDPIAAMARTKWKTAAATKPKKEKKGLAEEFFGTTFGKGLGTVINNPVAKAILQPLDVLGVPQRAIASTINEVGDTFSGEGFSFSDLYDQTNPLFAIHGENAEDSIGMGDVWQKHGKALGAGDNRYVDAAVGLVGDVATDPLTYFFGLGAVDKGLDALRSGTRLGAALKGVDAVDEAAAAANKARKGSRASLTGRQVLNNRIGEAEGLITRADPQILDRLYGGTNVGQEAITEIQRRAGRGLGAPNRTLSPAASELVETALNIKPNAARARVPFTGMQGKALPGTGAVADFFADKVGNQRMRFAQKEVGQEIGNMRAPIDVENAWKVFAQGENANPVDFAAAATAQRIINRSRPQAGKYLNLGQREVRKARKELVADIKKNGKEAFIDASETPGAQTGLNRLFTYARELAEKEFGVTIPNFGNDVLDYVPHVATQRFRRTHPNIVDKKVGRYGQGEQTLQKESGRLMRRGFQPGEVLDLGNGKTFTIPDVPSIKNINDKSMAELGYKMLEDDPIKLVDDYIQAVSEDVGRRAGRADVLAETTSSPRATTAAGAVNDYPAALSYNPGMPDNMVTEALREQEAAYARLGLPVQEADVLSWARRTADGQLDSLFGEELTRWVNVGENRMLLENPLIDEMLRNTAKQINQNPGLLARSLRAMNRYFKTFAVLSPGFHVRNGLSAIFMNMADGVEMRTTLRGMNEWHKFTKAAKGGADWAGGMEYIQSLRKTNPTVANALEAVMGSGAGGRFTEAGVGEGFGRFGAKLMENRITRKSQDAGAWVEGSVRMGMAMDALEKGGNVSDAVSRITRVHFDYSQVSRFDDKMKQFIPFWSFVSRNTPMQIMQQWSRPGAYQAYEHIRENFQDEEALAAMGGEEALPDYIRQGRGFSTSLIPGMNWLEPDLPHTRVSEDIERLANIGNDPLGATSNLSPVFTAPAEYATGMDFFTGRRFGEDDYEHVSNPLDWLAVLPGALTGNVKMVDGELFVKTEVVNAVEAMDPNFARASRLTGAGGQEASRIPEGWARWFGAPVRNITERQLASAETGRYYDEMDDRRIQQTLEQQARQARGG